MKTAIFVALGGALGSVLRYGVGVALSKLSYGRIPWGTFTVNVLGSFLIGLVIAYFDGRGAGGSPARIAATVGVLGGFTTYSAFAFEVVSLVQQRALASVFVYVTALAALSLGGCVVGIWLGRSLVG